MIRHLAPIIIPKQIGNPPVPNVAFKVVEELVSAIKDSNVKNVAVSADYSAGKSSVVETAKEEIMKEEKAISWWCFRKKNRKTRFLTISLALLNAGDRILEEETKSTGKKERVERKKKNKDIEYSLLQQLLYYDMPSKTPKSRFHRLGRVGIWKPFLWAACLLMALMACLILLEPSGVMVPSFIDHYAMPPERRLIINCVAVVLLAILFISFCIWIARHARVRIGKVRVKDAEVEVNTLSVFNQYLDEIIYFFASTRYNVVVFEDLDRFVDTGWIFGKLRELNRILNNSQYLKRIIKRKITFVYSVRDDLFDATRRVKFFDYIVPVIPVVNSSNAYDKLSEMLDEEDKKAIDGKDLLNLCEFFEDLRLIINIVNEYNLYKRVIRLSELKLSRKKLFGLIVYKNYCPDDFSKLHNRHGVLAQILNNKGAILNAVATSWKNKRDAEKETLQTLRAESKEWEKNLRMEYVKASKEQINYSVGPLLGFELQNGAHISFEKVAEDPALFVELVNNRLKIYSGSGRSFSILSFDAWQRVVNEKPYQERLKLNPNTLKINNQKELVDGIEPFNFSSASSFSEILKEKDVLDEYFEKDEKGGKMSTSVNEHQQLIRYLLVHDFLDEHYLDYITYFYPNSISIEDKRFVLNISSLDKESLPCTYSLVNPHAVADRFELSDYKTNVRLLNVDLALSLAAAGEKQAVNRYALQELAVKSKAKDFVLALYEKGQRKEVDAFLSELLEKWDFGAFIRNLDAEDDICVQKLREINLRYSNLKDPGMFNKDFQIWINGHFGFVASVIEEIGEKRVRDFLSVYKIRFSKINLTSVPSSFADFIIDGEHYSINSTNVESIASYLGILDDYKRAAYTTLHNCGNQSFSASFKLRPNEFLKSFPSSSIEEEPWAKALIAADGRISFVARKEYLLKQSSKISNVLEIKESALDFVFKYSLIEPLWENVYYLCFELRHEIPIDFLRVNNLEGFLQLKSEQQNAIVTQWVFSNSLHFNVYEKTVSSMSGFRRLAPNVELRRISILVSRQMLLFNVENYSDMKMYYPSLAVKFIVSNLNDYLKDIRSYTVSAVEMMGVMKSMDSYAKQSDYIANHPAFEGEMSVSLADMICALIFNRSLQVDKVEDILLIPSINKSSNDEKRLFVARRALFDLPYSARRSKEILVAMGGEFARICENGVYSWLPWNATNTRLAKYLSDNSFIKHYVRHGDRIKIIKY